MKTCEGIVQIKSQNHAIDIARYWMMRKLQENMETNQRGHRDYSTYYPGLYEVKAESVD